MHYHMIEIVAALGIGVLLLSGVAHLVGIPPLPWPPREDGASVGWSTTALFGVFLIVPMVARLVIVEILVLVDARKQERGEKRRP